MEGRNGQHVFVFAARAAYFFFFFAWARSDAIGPLSRFGVLGLRRSLPACEAVFFEVVIIASIGRSCWKGEWKAKLQHTMGQFVRLFSLLQARTLLSEQRR